MRSMPAASSASMSAAGTAASMAMLPRPRHHSAADGTFAVSTPHPAM